MRVEVLEEKLRSDGFNLVKGDTVTVPDEVGTAWCGHGWARDTEGKVETGERVVIGHTLQPAKARSRSRSRTRE